MEYGLIGERLGHSFSKPIHETLGGYSYTLMPLTREAFPLFMQKRDFSAINVTIPYKMDVIPYLDHIDHHAQTIGAVNTILHRDGKLLGYNTDFYGFLYLLQKNEIDPADKKVLVLGKGGASKAVLAVLKHLRAKKILTVYYKECDGTISYEEARQQHHDAAIIINTTPVGMYPDTDACPIALADYPTCEAVVDIIYNPLLPQLIVEGKKRGMIAVGGLEMLIAQAKAAAELFQSKTLPEDAVDTLYRQMLQERINIVLIGMPGSGKTTVGKEIAALLSRPFVDTDDVIISEIGMPIAEYFALYGEDSFRKVESAVLHRLSQQTGQVIATGGGVIKKEQNIDTLCQNGILLFLKRSTDALEIGHGRPLSQSSADVNRLYEERLPLYQKYCHASIKNDAAPEQIAKDAVVLFHTMVQDI